MMNKEILRKVGLTEGEIKVYEAVVKLGETSTGPIMEKSGISSSKVYLILDKLIKKGFVSCTNKNNVKFFHPSNPVNIIEYLNKQQKDIEKTKKEAEKLVGNIQSLIGSYEKETIQMYQGTKSMLSAFQNIVDEVGREKFLFIGAPVKDLDDLQLFFQNLQAKREQKNIKTWGLADISTKKRYINMFKARKNIKVQFVKLPFPHAIGIGTKRIIFSLWGDTPLGFEIISERMAQRYRTYFFQLWKKSET